MRTKRGDPSRGAAPLNHDARVARLANQRRHVHLGRGVHEHPPNSREFTEERVGVDADVKRRAALAALVPQRNLVNLAILLGLGGDHRGGDGGIRGAHGEAPPAARVPRRHTGRRRQSLLEKLILRGLEPKRPRHRHGPRPDVHVEHRRGRPVVGVDEVHGDGPGPKVQTLVRCAAFDVARIRVFGGLRVEGLKLEGHLERLAREEEQPVPGEGVVLHAGRDGGQAGRGSQRAPLRGGRDEGDVRVVASNLENAVAIRG